MRTQYRVVTTLVAVAAVFPVIGISSAYANTAEPAVIQGAWYWHDQKVVVGPEVLSPPAPASGVPAKDLAVAYKGDDGTSADKVTYLAWDFSGIPLGSTVSKFEFTMEIATDPTAVQVTPPDYKIVACGAIGDFTAVEGANFSQRPADDCSAQVPGTFNSTAKTWTFDVAPYAQLWANGDPAFGIGLLPAPGTKEPFQVVFKPASTVKTSVEYTLPEPPPPTATTTVAPPPTVGTGYLPLPPVTIVPPPVTAAPAPTQPPVVALPPSRPTQQVARSGLTWPKKSGLPGSFWLGALAAVVLLGFASLVLGDATVVAEQRRGTTLTRSLRERQNARTRAPSPKTQIRTV